MSPVDRTGWTRVAASADVTERPIVVDVAGAPYVLLRDPGGAPALVAPRCPHRLVPLDAAHVADGVLTCRYHGWQFGLDGSCLRVPSMGDVEVPRGAHLAPAPPVLEDDGIVWAEVVAPAGGRTPPRASLTNTDPALAHAWHAVLAADATGDEHAVRLLGRDLVLRRNGSGWTSEPAVHGIVERWGLVHVALSEPRVPLFEDPDVEDAAYVGAWLPPSRTVVTAGAVADNFLDVAHFPFVHAGTFGSDVEVVPAYDVIEETNGFRRIQDQEKE